MVPLCVSVPFRGIGRLRPYSVSTWSVTPAAWFPSPFGELVVSDSPTELNGNHVWSLGVSVPFRGIGRLRRVSAEEAQGKIDSVSVPFRGIGRLRLSREQLMSLPFIMFPSPFGELVVSDTGPAQQFAQGFMSFRPLSGNWSSPTLSFGNFYPI